MTDSKHPGSDPSPPWDWILAATPYHERLEWLREGAITTVGAGDFASAADEWGILAGLDDPLLLQRYLEGLNVTVEEHHAVLGQLRLTRDRPVPPWFTRLRELARQWTNAAPDFDSSTDAAPFRPITDALADSVVDSIQSKSDVALPPAVWDGLRSALSARLHWLIAPALTLELHRRGDRGALQGESGRARFVDFLQQLSSSSDQSLFSALRAFPVLSRQIVFVIDGWTRNASQFVSALASDDLQSVYGRDCTASEVVALHPEDSDPHHGQSAVYTVTFRTGTKLVYKPRSTWGELAFYNAQRWLCQAVGIQASVPAVLDRITHGWMEWVEPAACESSEEIHRFYYRHGLNLALLHFLSGSDVHHQNVLAVREHPYIVDLECLLVPRADGLGATLDDFRAVRESPLLTGLLPTWSADEHGRMHDLGGITALPSSVAGKTWERRAYSQPCTDEMMIVPADVSPFPPTHLPVDVSQGESAICPADIRRGWEEGYDAIQRSQDEFVRLVASSLPRRPPVRWVQRMTQDYLDLLRVGSHPEYLTDARRLDGLYARLPLIDGSDAFSAWFLREEWTDLWNHDVPRFTLDETGRRLSAGRPTRLQGLVATEPLSELTRRVGRASFHEARRGWHTAALALSARTGVDTSDWSRVIGVGSPLAHATAIGRELAELNYGSSSEPVWLNISSTEEVGVVAPAGASLYTGSAGIALFLGYLASQTGDDEAASLAAAAVRSALRQALAPASDMPWGAFDGRLSVSYAALHLSVLLDDPTLLAAAVELATAAPRDVASVDIMSGVAGQSLVLLRLLDVEPSLSLRGTLTAFAEMLMERAKVQEVGVAWPPLDGGQPMLGFAHGGSGVAVALMELSRSLGDEALADAARSALEYDRHLFGANDGAWPDHRNGKKSHEPSGWCHGGSGQALARLSLSRYLDDPLLTHEIDIGIELSRGQLSDSDDSMCHGAGALIDVIEERSVGRSVGVPASRPIATFILTRSAQSGRWRPGGPAPAPTLGLMTGIAGIGFGMLRSEHSSATPSVLQLSGPYRPTRTSRS